MTKTTLARLSLVGALLLAGCGVNTPAPVAADRTGAASAKALKDPTPLQKHLMFFDENGDDILTLDETKHGLARLGLNSASSLGGAVFIHAGLSQASAGGFKLSIAKIQAAKHKSDSGAFDENGRFVPEAFERIMSFDANQSGSLSWTELKAMIAANKTDTKGNLASKAEFGLLVAIGADTTEPESGESVKAVSRKRLASIYTGTLFYDIAEDRAHRKQSPFDAKLPE